MALKYLSRMEENMTDKVIENNQVAVMGEIVSDFPSATRFSERAFIW